VTARKVFLSLLWWEVRGHVATKGNGAGRTAEGTGEWMMVECWNIILLHNIQVEVRIRRSSPLMKSLSFHEKETKAWGGGGMSRARGC
jgi:hypothetical protein